MPDYTTYAPPMTFTTSDSSYTTGSYTYSTGPTESTSTGSGSGYGGWTFDGKK